MRRSAVFAAAALQGALMMSPSASAEDGAAVATIDVSAGEGGVRIVGRAAAPAAGRYEARMVVEKRGPAGRTSTTQGGAVSLEAGGSADVATVGLSMVPGDQLAVELVLSAAGGEVARATLAAGGD